MPAAFCCPTTPATAARSSCWKRASSADSPDSRARFASIRSSGRGRLPAWEVRMRSRLPRTGSAPRLDPHVEVAALLLQLVRSTTGLRIAARLARAHVELPHVLEAGEDPAVVDTVGERHVLVRTEGLVGEELVAGVGHHDGRPVLDGELLEAVGRNLVRPAHT